MLTRNEVSLLIRCWKGKGNGQSLCLGCN